MAVSSGFEPETNVSKTCVISISPRDPLVFLSVFYSTLNTILKINVNLSILKIKIKFNKLYHRKKKNLITIN